MRAIWKGAVSFGLVSVPVRLYSATESHDLQFHQVRASDGSRIKYKRVAEADGKEVAYAEIAKGYQTPDGRTVILSDEDLASLPSRSSREIAVEKFVPADQIDPLWFDKSYYLEPDAAAVKQYSLLREALRDADRMALVTIAVRSRTTMAVLRVRDDVIVLQTLLWPDEVRRPDFDVLGDVPAAKDAEVKMADMLVESMAGDFDPQEYDDDYQEAVEALVQSKIAGDEVTAPAAPEADTGEVVDLLAALQKSIERAKAARGGGGKTADDAAAGDDEGGDDAATGAGDDESDESSGDGGRVAPAGRGGGKATKTASKSPAKDIADGEKGTSRGKAATSTARTTKAKDAPEKKATRTRTSRKAG